MKKEIQVAEMLERAKAWQETCVECGDKTAEIYTTGQVEMLRWVLGLLDTDIIQFTPLLPITDYRKEK